MPIIVEAAIDSISAAEQAVREGADRLEVCRDLDLGGLTPSSELLRECLALGVPCVAMARPRAGDFTYDTVELARVRAMVSTLCEAGVHGVVFGVLRRDQRVDLSALRAIVRICGGTSTVFHRAFDHVPSAVDALDALIELGVTRVLTAGQAATAAQGADTLARLVERAAGRIEILPGGAIRAGNVSELVSRSGVLQVHARGTEPGVIAAIKAVLAVSNQDA